MNIKVLAEQFIAGKVLLFNKPICWTSFDLVGKVRKILKTQLHLKKIKVGHAGTLDPLATGLMLVCTGNETKNIERYQAGFKEYTATIRLGATTPSFDLETDVDQYFQFEHITRSAVEEVLKHLSGSQLQDPPRFSARMMNGTRAYKMARKGAPVALQAKQVSIKGIILSDFQLPFISLVVRCSKGTYIRGLARDIGYKLGSGAHLIRLIRTRIGPYELKDAINIEDFERNLVFL
jgi:tRNA pseudouridine55 synthase